MNDLPRDKTTIESDYSEVQHAAENNFIYAPPAKDQLTKLFRRIAVDFKISGHKYDRLMNSYLDNPANGVGKDPRARSTAKGNMDKALFKETMTWKVFLKAIRFLNPVKATFSVRLEFASGVKTEHNISLMTREPKKRRIEEPESDD